MITIESNIEGMFFYQTLFQTFRYFTDLDFFCQSRAFFCTHEMTLATIGAFSGLIEAHGTSAERHMHRNLARFAKHIDASACDYFSALG